MKLTVQPFTRFLFLLTLCLLGFLTSARVAQANQLKGVRIWPSPDSTRIVLDLSEKPNYSIHYLKEPDRLLIDLQSSTSRVDLSKIKKTGPLVKALRETGSGQKGTYRIAIDLKKASKARVFTLSPEKPYGHRLVLDLPHEQPKADVVVPEAEKRIVLQPAGRDIVIAIDAGHGGEDPGALGKYTYEKNVTLAIAKRLEKRINQQKGMHAFLIRNGDYFINLNKRSAIARKKKADFLVSIHADGFTSSRPRGASVWVLSNRRATSELGRWMEKHEAHSELLGGAGDLIQDSNSVPFLTEMFLDMSMGNAMDVGYHAGDLVVKELKKVTQLHKTRPVHASLAVLKSPDIPSILVEAGFITNRTEEKLLNQAEHQNKIANAVFTGIYKHFLDAPPQNTLFAQKKRAIKHTVRSGESLSQLADRYSVSTQNLLSYNNLQSKNLRIGQIIKIPPNYQLVVEHKPVVVPTLKPQPDIIHKVQRGESLSLIAQHYGKSLQALKTYNKLRSTSLAIGQKINIPGQSVATVAVPPAPRQKIQQVVVHKVKRGESLSLIAQHYGQTVEQLKTYNKLRSTVLAVGQKIKVPGQMVDAVQVAKIEPIVQPVQDITYQVKSGESLSVIASRYGKSTSELKAYNKLRSTSLQVGQKLKIPGQQVATAQIAEVVERDEPLQSVIHTVKSGESLSVIASRYGKSTSELKAYNKLSSTVLAVGQKIKVSGQMVDAVQVAETKPIVQPVQDITYLVKSGESLSVIASRYGKSTSELKAYNKLHSSALQVGQKLKIPDQQVATTQIVKVVEQSAPLQSVIHTVKSGESLSVIASRYGKSTSELKVYNKLHSSALQVGQKLKIPDQQVATTQIAEVVERDAPLPSVIHTVKSGESLSVIASRYGKSTSELKADNKLRSTSLQVGQKLKISGIARESTSPQSTLKIVTHKVRSGESLSLIGQRYGKTVNQLKAYNKLSSTSLQVGQIIKIPNGDYRAPVVLAKAKTVTHRVKRGESLSVIASHFGTTAKVLKAYNKLRSSALQVGQKIKIPTSFAQLTKHKVRSGESLSVIASRYGTTTHVLKAFNQLRSSTLAIGQVLTVPLT